MEALADEIRRRLGPMPELSRQPLVSIVVLNHDGEEHLRRLLRGLVERTDYPHLELIVVDNGSSDGSVDFLRAVRAPFPVSIVANAHNESFSDANNKGAELVSGELLLFLNNDIEPFESGWLTELVACARQPQVGAVGATLIVPNRADRPDAGYRVQSRGVTFQGSGDHIAPAPAGDRRDVFGEGFGEDIQTVLAVGACILIDCGLFRRIGGFTRGFFFGGEDMDLCLKLRAEGLAFAYSGRSFLIHGAGSTFRETMDDGQLASLRRANSYVLLSKWGARAWREYELDRLAGGGVWAASGQEELAGAPSRDEVLRLGFCVKTAGAKDATGTAARALCEELDRRGHRHLHLHDAPVDERQSFVYDVVVCLRGALRHVPNPHRLNVLWIVSNAETVTGVECKRYDLAATVDAKLATRLSRDSGSTPVVALDPEQPAGDLLEAARRRAAEIDSPTRVAPQCPEGRCGT